MNGPNGQTDNLTIPGSHQGHNIGEISLYLSFMHFYIWWNLRRFLNIQIHVQHSYRFPAQLLIRLLHANVYLWSWWRLTLAAAFCVFVNVRQDQRWNKLVCVSNVESPAQDSTFHEEKLTLSCSCIATIFWICREKEKKIIWFFCSFVPIFCSSATVPSSWTRPGGSFRSACDEIVLVMYGSIKT